ncbi:ureidoglycolate/malate/sulfolactate dehydrogenase family [Klebsiella pneumoniae]|uniref:Ldh family oxidoreductase n=3 Tax=Klebsiella pneumoniae TaxID=573 RepID=UPI001090D290|nr:Ldh family oxidoreductase [Klebsiella pneumoniae]VGK47386.1 ureidoglycolate/malate/sulfolactate dehydrogenase family [Klebsiella pneumoniae]
MESVTLSLPEAYDLALEVLSANGFSADHAAAIARNVTAGERDGCASHGLWRLLGIVDTLRKGKVSPDAEPQIHDQAPGIARADAGGAFSLLAYERALPLLLEKARHNGIAALAINRCVHFSALFADIEPQIHDQAPGIARADAGGAFSLLAYERALPLLLEKARHNGIAALAINRCVHFSALFADIEPLTEAGLVGLACTPSHAWVAPAGGTRPLFGTNPIAFGWPRQDKPPFIVDMATSAAARGEIQLHQRSGKALPEGWGIDSQGQPTTDAAEVLNGAMLTFGGHKGSALAAMVELLAGPLIGDMTSAESLAWDNGAGGLPYGGELILALDPQRFLGAQAPEQLARAETLFMGMQEQGARLPGERRFACRQQSERQGVIISRSLHDEICALRRGG